MIRHFAPAILIAITLSIPAIAAANLVSNGSFETGPDPGPGGSMLLAGGSTTIPSWLVTHTNVRYCGTYSVAADGVRTVALNGNDTGGISQTFTTEARAQYAVEFCMSADPFAVPAVKNMRVSAAGQSADFSFDNTGVWNWLMNWTPHTFAFTANSTSTTLEFLSLMTGNSGPMIDSVVVVMTAPAGVGGQPATEFALSAATPNPAHSSSRVDFTVPSAAPVEVKVLDVAGRDVATLARGEFAPGRYSRAWDGRAASGAAPAGLYFIRMRTPERVLVRKLVLER